MNRFPCIDPGKVVTLKENCPLGAPEPEVCEGGFAANLILFSASSTALVDLSMSSFVSLHISADAVPSLAWKI